MTFYTETIIDQAYEWLCQRRKDYHYNNDVWHLRFHWDREKARLLKQLQDDSFRFDWVDEIRTPNRTTFLWRARDALVLKAMAIYLEGELRPILSDRIFHLAGTQEVKKGCKAAVRAVCEALPAHQFVLRTDVRGYYAAINHELLMEQLESYVDDPFLLRLLFHFLQHLVCDDHGFHTIQEGISRLR